MIINPPKIQEWHLVQSMVRAWETHIEEYDRIANHPVQDDTKQLTLQEMLPKTLEEKAISHPSYDEGYRAWRDHVTSVVARRMNRRATTPATMAIPRPSPSPGGQIAPPDQLNFASGLPEEWPQGEGEDLPEP